MVNDDGPRKPAWVGFVFIGVSGLVLLFGLCTIFAGAVTVVQAWQEHTQERWPEVTARVENCRMQRSSTGQRNRYYIDCRLGYEIGDEENVAEVYSVSAYASNNGPLAEWVDDHPIGTPVAVRYDPSNHKKIVLSPPYMPGGGPRSANNVRLLIALAGGFVVLLFFARVLWTRFRLNLAVGHGQPR